MLKRLAVPYRLTILLLLICVACPLAARADGGPVVGPHLWASLKEGKQIAVVTLKDTETAEVDLFISMLDATGESHDVVFFVPLGFEADDFNVYEQNSLWFDQYCTKDLDVILSNEAGRRDAVINSLFAGTLLTNGVWLLPLWLPALLSGCAAPVPEATFETDSSQVSIFGLDEDTDLDALISTTGLDPAVQASLSRRRGQRIAVVTLQTQPKGNGDTEDGSSPYDGERGLHLSWETSLVDGQYSYPLGTGDAWYHPIEMTRVYVVAPPGVDFNVSYPELGADRSGYIRQFNGRGPRIADYYQVPAYAVDEAGGDFGRVWRATYTQSNAAEDIVITATPQSWLSKVYLGMQGAGNGPVAFFVGLVVAVVFWILGWRYLMPRLLGAGYQGSAGNLQRRALTYTFTNLGLMFPGIVLYLFWSWTGNALAFVLLLVLFGGVSTLIFALGHLKRLGTNAAQVVKAYVLVTLASNGAYLIFSLAFAKLTGAI